MAGFAKRADQKKARTLAVPCVAIAVIAALLIVANNWHEKSSNSFSKNDTGILVLRIVGDDENSLQRYLVSSFSKVVETSPTNRIFALANNEQIDATKIISHSAAHEKARNIEKRFNAKIVVWGHRASEKGFFANVTIVDEANNITVGTSSLGERSLPIQNISEYPLPQILVDEPVFIAFLTAALSSTQKNQDSDAIRFLNLAKKHVKDVSPENVFLHYALGSSRLKLAQYESDPTAILIAAAKDFQAAENAGKPNFSPFVFITWGVTLLLHANLKGDTYEASKLLEEAAGKFLLATFYTPKLAKAFIGSGLVSSQQAKLRGNTPEAEALYRRARTQFEEAVQIESLDAVSLYNWGIILSEHAKNQGSIDEADRLFQEAGFKFAKAVGFEPAHELFKNWGIVLAERARRKGNTQEADKLFQEAGQKYNEAVRINPKDAENYQNWGFALSDQARRKGNTLEALKLFEEGGDKYAAAVKLNSNNQAALVAWGTVLASQAAIKGNTVEGDKLFQEAREKYAEVTRIKPKHYEALFNWGTSLFRQALLKGNTPEAALLLQEAGSKFHETLQDKPDLIVAWEQWGSMLLLQAQLNKYTPEEVEKFVEESRKKFAEAKRLRSFENSATGSLR